jgi:hypothetical protein
MKDKGDWKRDRHSGRGEGEDNSQYKIRFRVRERATDDQLEGDWWWREIGRSGGRSAS